MLDACRCRTSLMSVLGDVLDVGGCLTYVIDVFYSCMFLMLLLDVCVCVFDVCS